MFGGFKLSCGSGLICVDKLYCDNSGLATATPNGLTADQELRRAPLTPCKLPLTAVEGFCCRDPFYTDPWPGTIGGGCPGRNFVSLFS